MPLREKFDLSGRTALITGAARGIGRACAEGLAEFGADIALVDIHADNLAAARAELAEAWGVAVETYQCDATDDAAVAEMVAAVTRRFGRIDILINSVGITIWQDTVGMSLEQWQRVMDVNLTSTFLCCREVGRHMIERGGGSIVSIASMSAHIVNTPQNQVAYNASKAAMIQLTRSLAAEWAPHAIRVNTISPGYTLTEMTQTVPEHHPGWCERIPMGRMAEPSEIAGAAVFLASDASGYITGHDLVIDGGYICW